MAVGVRTQLALSHLSIRPGAPARVEIEVTNTSDVIDGVTAIVDGIDPNWIRFDAPVVSLFPSSTATLGFTIDTPFDYPAGDYLVVVRVVSTIDADRQTVHDFWITVEPSLGIEMRIRPSIINGGRTAEIVATVRSTGNTTAVVGVTALDPGRQVDCRVVPPDLAVPRGTEGTTIVRLRGPRPWFGQPASRSIVITARSDDLVVEEIATFNQKPRIPRGVLTFLLLAGIIALWATIFLLVANALGSDDAPGKAAATRIQRGRRRQRPARGDRRDGERAGHCRHHRRRSGLAGAVGAEEGEQFAGFDAQVEAIDRQLGAVLLGDPAQLDHGLWPPASAALPGASSRTGWPPGGAPGRRWRGPRYGPGGSRRGTR